MSLCLVSSAGDTSETREGEVLWEGVLRRLFQNTEATETPPVGSDDVFLGYEVPLFTF